jgi:diaminopimelate epimerase
MKKIPVVKFTSQGNNFVILDESVAPVLTEKEKSSFAYHATDVNYGIGSDNFLVIQASSPDVLRVINNGHRYWEQVPDFGIADYIFRMFEPDGAEAFSCANGLMCVARYLSHKYAVKSARVMTEIPTAQPKVVHVGTNGSDEMSWVNLGHPRQIPTELALPSQGERRHETIDTIEGIKIMFRKHDLAPLHEGRTLEISGHLVFTGEPHLVVFVENGFSLKDLGNALFISPLKNRPDSEKNEKRAAYGTWLVHHIGSYINRSYRNLFSAGINVNFVKVNKTAGTIDYRCFERGIYRETLACGTGALASSFVAKELGFVKSNPIVAYPYRSLWHDSKARIVVKEQEKGWILSGNSRMLLEGSFILRRNANHRDRFSDSRKAFVRANRDDKALSYRPVALTGH